MLNFTIGPVQMDKETLEIGQKQIPYFRTHEFSALMQENEKILCHLFDAPENSRVIFLTGSGTASMEAGIMNFFTKKDKVLIVNGGSFGYRFVELCQIHEVPFTEITIEYGKPLQKKILYQYDHQNYTGMVLQLCETSTGVLYDMNMVGDFCKKNNIFLFVDAVSGFMADEFSMKKMHINAAITGSQKALSLPPSMSFTIMDRESQERCCKHIVKSMYFNYADYLKNGERGQTPYTPAVSTLIQLNEKLKRIEKNGGIATINANIQRIADYFRKKIQHLPLKMFTALENSSNCLSALTIENNKINARELCEIIKNEYDIYVCPNGGDLAEKIFRVGHIGNITKEQIDQLIDAFDDLVKRKIL